MRVLIIGGTGLISTAITRFLVARGDDVTLYNRGQTDADIPEGYNIIIGNFDAVIDMISFVPADVENRKDYGTFEAQMAEAGNFDLLIGWMPADAFTTKMNPKFIAKLLSRWQHLRVKETFFRGD